MLDWSLAGVLGERQRVAMAQILLAAWTLRPDQIASVLEELTERPLDHPSRMTVVHRWVKRIRQGQMPGVNWLVGMLDDTARNARMRVGVDVLLLRKALHTLENMVGDLRAKRAGIDQMLWREFAGRFLGEWRQRRLAPPASCAFVTRLSNADLTHAMLSLPCTAARFWWEHGLDLLETCVPATQGDV